MHKTIQSGMKVISQDQVIMLNKGIKGLSLLNKSSLVKFESQKYKLKNVYSTEELQLKRPA